MPRGLLGDSIISVLLQSCLVTYPAQTLYDSSFCVSNKYRCAMLAAIGLVSISTLVQRGVGCLEIFPKAISLYTLLD